MTPLPWYETMSVIACLVMACYAFFVCYVMPQRGQWGKRLVVWALVGTLGLHIAAPWAVTLPTVAWYTAVLHALMAVSLLIWHRHVMRFVVREFLQYESLDSDNVPLDEAQERTVWDSVHNVFVVNRRRMLRRFRDREMDRRKS